jgi:Ca2+-binding EF-hand superfamily protein
MLHALDSNADGSVTLGELAAYDTPPPTPTPPAPTPPATDPGSSVTRDPAAPPPAPTFIAMSLTTVASIAQGASAKTFASNMLKSFDATGKGYFTADDVRAAFTADATLGDPAKAQSIVSELDGNGDGQVTHEELVASFQRLDIVSNLLGAFDPAGDGQIDIASLTGPAAAVSPALTAMLKTWDADSDGHLTSSEMIAGLKASPIPLGEMSALANAVNASINAQSAMAQYDVANKGYMTAADLTASWSADQGANDPSTAQSAIASWDANGDAQVNLGEMISGQQVTDVANQLLSQFDPGGQGYIEVAGVLECRRL